MKKLLVLTMVAVLATSVAFTKPPKEKGPVKLSHTATKAGPGAQVQRRGHFRAELYKKLKLTATQKKKVEAIDAKFSKQFEAFRAKRDPKGYEAMRGMNEKRNKEIMAVLDKNQKKIYEAEMKKWQQMRRRGPGGPGAPKAPGAAAKPKK